MKNRTKVFLAIDVAVLAWLAWPQAHAAGAPPDLQARSLAATCTNCHGTHGQAQGVMPALAGLPAEQIARTMAEFKAGTRAATLMHQIAKGYSDEQIRLIAEHFAAQPAATVQRGAR